MQTNRRLPSLILGLMALLLVSLVLTACGSEQLLTNVGVSRAVFTPDGDAIEDSTEISYTLSRNAKVTVEIIDGNGVRYPIAESLDRVAGSYVARFTGAVATDPERLQRKLLPDGTYQFRVEAVDDRGVREEQTGEFAITGGDPVPLEIRDLTTDRPVISPNGDGEEDEASIAYMLTKPAVVTIYAVRPDGSKVILEPPTERKVGPATHHWNGTSGTEVLPDGDYVVHVRAEDTSGNVADVSLPIKLVGGGKPQVEITSVEFWPDVVPVSGYLNVTVRVKNTGDVAVKTLGPPPGTEYSTDQTFNYWTTKRADGTEVVKYYERPGHWRVAVGWNLAGRPYPVRWAFLEPTIDAEGNEHYPMLEPGQEATIKGRIQILYNETEELYFWAGIEQGGVGFPGGDVGLKRIRVSY